MSKKLIIDGYNLLFSWNEAKDIFVRNQDDGFKFLIDNLSFYRKQKRVKIKIIFDAYNSFSLRPQNLNQKGISIAFTPMGEKADDFIKKIIKSDKEKYIVVTSDNEIKQFAEKLDIPTINSDDFVSKVEFSKFIEFKGINEDEIEFERKLDTKKKGNPKKLPKKLRKKYNKLRGL